MTRNTLTTPKDFITASAWYAYDKVQNGHGQFDFIKPLPGWRVDHVYPDGSIADYNHSGTRQGRCMQEIEHRIQRHFAPPAVDHLQGCDCGYRVCRYVWDLLKYISITEIARHSRPQPYDYIDGLGLRPGKPPSSMVLTRTYAYGTAEKNLDPVDPPGTIRISKTRLAEVYLPTEFNGQAVPNTIAQQIRDRYEVPVQRIDGTVLDFSGSPTDPPPPALWPDYRTVAKEDLEAAINGTLM